MYQLCFSFIHVYTGGGESVSQSAAVEVAAPPPTVSALPLTVAASPPTGERSAPLVVQDDGDHTPVETSSSVTAGPGGGPDPGVTAAPGLDSGPDPGVTAAPGPDGGPDSGPTAAPGPDGGLDPGVTVAPGPAVHTDAGAAGFATTDRCLWSRQIQHG